MAAYLYAILALVTWSLYPVLTAFGILAMNPVLFVLIVQIAAGFGSLAFTLPSIKSWAEVKSAKRREVRQAGPDVWLYLVVIGLCSALFNLFIVFAMALIEPASVTIIVQTSPILTMLFSYLFITKAWKRLGLPDVGVALMSAIGAGLVILGNPTRFDKADSPIARMFTDTPNPENALVIGAALAIVGTLMLTLSDTLRAQVSNVIEGKLTSSMIRGDKTLPAAMMGEVVCRIFSIIPAALIWWAMGAPMDTDIPSLLAAIVTGFLIFNLASAASTVSLLKAKSSAITLIYFMGPVLSVFWLYLASLSQFTHLTLIGMAVIILGNFALYWVNEHRPKKRALS